MTGIPRVARTVGEPELLADQPEFLSVQEIANLLRLSTWTLHEAIRMGELPAIRWGRRVIVGRDDMRVFLLARQGSFGQPRSETLAD